MSVEYIISLEFSPRIKAFVTWTENARFGDTAGYCQFKQYFISNWQTFTSGHISTVMKSSEPKKIWCTIIIGKRLSLVPLCNETSLIRYNWET